MCVICRVRRSLLILIVPFVSIATHVPNLLLAFFENRRTYFILLPALVLSFTLACPRVQISGVSVENADSLKNTAPPRSQPLIVSNMPQPSHASLFLAMSVASAGICEGAAVEHDELEFDGMSNWTGTSGMGNGAAGEDIPVRTAEVTKINLLNQYSW